MFDDRRASFPPPNPSGLCLCGCGQPTLIAKINRRTIGHLAGHPIAYIHGHNPAKRGKDSHKWKGGRTRRYGYALLYAPDHPDADTKGYVPEHRVVAEHMLGRPLEKNEHVHHVNGVKDDNRPENLVVLTKHLHGKLHGTAIFESYFATHDRQAHSSEAGKKGAQSRWHSK